MRRSELIARQYDHLHWTPQGMVPRIARLDLDSIGMDIGNPHIRNERICPITHLRRWMEQAKIMDGTLSRRVDRWG